MSLKPIIKWPGGKTHELPIIKQNIPDNFNRYIEPFIGGGSVFFSMDIKKAYINDYSEELMKLYQFIQNEDDDFFIILKRLSKTWQMLENIVSNNEDHLKAMYKEYSRDLKRLDKKILDKKFNNKIYDFIIKNSKAFNGLLEESFNYDIDNFINQSNKSLINKIKRMSKIEDERGKLSETDILLNLETAFKASYYTHFRYIYNNKDFFNLSSSFASALFYFIREYCYSSMFRYNKDGEFNVPYGGISYNRKAFDKKIDYIQSKQVVKHLSRADIYSMDFEGFLKKVKPNENDFIFLDPPYDTDFSTYAKNDFDKQDQIRLATYLENTSAKYMLIIKNTPFIYDLYKDIANISLFDKNYLVSFKNRNKKDVKHLLITNY